MAGTFQFLFDLLGFVWYVALWFRVQIGLLWLYFNRRASHSADIKKATIKQCCRITIIGDGTYLSLSALLRALRGTRGVLLRDIVTRLGMVWLGCVGVRVHDSRAVTVCPLGVMFDVRSAPCKRTSLSPSLHIPPLPSRPHTLLSRRASSSRPPTLRLLASRLPRPTTHSLPPCLDASTSSARLLRYRARIRRRRAPGADARRVWPPGEKDQQGERGIGAEAAVGMRELWPLRVHIRGLAAGLWEQGALVPVCGVAARAREWVSVYIAV